MTRLVALASHEGMTLQAILDACSRGSINADVALVVSNNSQCGAMQRAARANIATLHLSGKTHPDDDARDEAMLLALREAHADWVLLLGYMKKLGPRTLHAYDGHILNTHPALLPKFGGKGFYGRRVHEAVVAAQETQSGATIHLVGTDYDTGPLLAQVRVPVDPQDTPEALEFRVKIAEQALLIDTLAELIASRQASNY